MEPISYKKTVFSSTVKEAEEIFNKMIVEDGYKRVSYPTHTWEPPTKWLMSCFVIKKGV